MPAPKARKKSTPPPSRRKSGFKISPCPACGAKPGKPHEKGCVNEVCAECGMRGGNHEMHCTDHPNYVVNGTTGVKLRKSERGRASNALKEALESRDATIGVLAQRGLDLREPHLPGVAMDGGADPTGDADESDDDDFDGDEDGEDEGGE